MMFDTMHTLFGISNKLSTRFLSAQCKKDTIHDERGFSSPTKSCCTMKQNPRGIHVLITKYRSSNWVQVDFQVRYLATRTPLDRHYRPISKRPTRLQRTSQTLAFKKSHRVFAECKSPLYLRPANP